MWFEIESLPQSTAPIRVNQTRWSGEIIGERSDSPRRFSAQEEPRCRHVIVLAD
jgi:hypothetical protein